jgi:hypothetical protein
MIQKARYYNNAHTAVTLWIDDFVPAAITTDGQIHPSNDWGYGYDGPNSLYHYLDETLWKKHPEIKGTFFIPLKSHHYIQQNGYEIFKRDFDSGFGEFARKISDRFDFAFHGVKHTYYTENSGYKKLMYEFNEITEYDIPNIRAIIDDFKKTTGITLSGGKFPGNRGNIVAFNSIDELGFFWWTHRKLFNVKDIQKLDFITIGKQNEVIDLPQTFTGDALKYYYLWKGSKRNRIINMIKSHYKVFRSKAQLYFLYQNRIPITIQEHFQNATNTGNRQIPNIYDDTCSLEKIYSILRGADLWYATANQLAHYADSFRYSLILHSPDNSFDIKYEGKQQNPKLTLICEKNMIKRISDNEVFHGFLKNHHYVFNNITPGKYLMV